jgi:hypothetical protein
MSTCPTTFELSNIAATAPADPRFTQNHHALHADFARTWAERIACPGRAPYFDHVASRASAFGTGAA